MVAAMLGLKSPSRYASSCALHAEHFTVQYLLRHDQPIGSATCGCQLARERRLAAVDERLDVAERHPHGVGDLLVFEMVEVAQHESAAHLLGDVAQRVA